MRVNDRKATERPRLNHLWVVFVRIGVGGLPRLVGRRLCVLPKLDARNGDANTKDLLLVVQLNAGLVETHLVRLDFDVVKEPCLVRVVVVCVVVGMRRADDLVAVSDGILRRNRTGPVDKLMR